MGEEGRKGGMRRRRRLDRVRRILMIQRNILNMYITASRTFVFFFFFINVVSVFCFLFLVLFVVVLV